MLRCGCGKSLLKRSQTRHSRLPTKCSWPSALTFILESSITKLSTIFRGSNKTSFAIHQALPAYVARQVLRCTIYENSFAPPCSVESDSTDAAVSTTSTQGWQATLTRPRLSHRNSVRPPQRNTLGDVAARAGLRFGHDLLAAVT
jgi:hypothetical protein